MKTNLRRVDLIVGYLQDAEIASPGCSTLAEAAAGVCKTCGPMSVVSDVGLPDGNGANFCMDNVSRLPHARWLVMSAQSDMLRHIRNASEAP